MKVGDLVKFFSDESDHANEIGIIICEVPGSKVLKETDNQKVVVFRAAQYPVDRPSTL